jgi:hypothetical protein
MCRLFSRKIRDLNGRSLADAAFSALLTFLLNVIAVNHLEYLNGLMHCGYACWAEAAPETANLKGNS